MLLKTAAMDGRTFTSLSDNVLVFTTPVSLQAKAEPRNAFLGEAKQTRLVNELCRAILPCILFETEGACRPARENGVIGW
ncbi:hypothetical protein [Caldalkalibacillus salinus]|uniref:hypothetical protein n=1 Tax=Caldalkalibacillus salinus TaxID=2803787 RepID=UPI001922493F|nr:hypothetical protein [Caldalkalibacillus salinus]